MFGKATSRPCRVHAPIESSETPLSKTLARLAFLLYRTLRTPARFWSAPAERSDEGALDRLPTALETPCSCAARPPNPKRRGASLPAALQDAGASATMRRNRPVGDPASACRPRDLVL